MQFKSFHWFSVNDMSNYNMLYRYGKHMRNFLGVFNFYFILVLYIFKKLFHTRLFDVRLLLCLNTGGRGIYWQEKF